MIEYIEYNEIRTAIEHRRTLDKNYLHYHKLVTIAAIELLRQEGFFVQVFEYSVKITW